MIQSVGRTRKIDCIRCVGNQSLGCALKTLVTDINNIASTLMVKKVKIRQQTAQKIAKIILHGQGSCFEYCLCVKLAVPFIFTLIERVKNGLFAKVTVWVSYIGGLFTMPRNTIWCRDKAIWYLSFLQSGLLWLHQQCCHPIWRTIIHSRNGIIAGDNHCVSLANIAVRYILQQIAGVPREAEVFPKIYRWRTVSWTSTSEMSNVRIRQVQISAFANNGLERTFRQACIAEQLIDWFIISYESGNKRKQYEKSSCKKVTNCQWKLQ